MNAKADGNDDQHQQVCDSWVIGEIAKNLSDLATGLGKIGRGFSHSESSVCFNAFISVFIAVLALFVLLDVRAPFGALLTSRFDFFGFADFFVIFFTVGFFFVMRRWRFTMKTTPKLRCQFEGQNHRQ